jgi:hypothetical protein
MILIFRGIKKSKKNITIDITNDCEHQQSKDKN